MRGTGASKITVGYRRRWLPTSSAVAQEFGAGNIWIIDPETFEAEIHTSEGSSKVEDGMLRVSGTPIEVPLHRLEND